MTTADYLESLQDDLSRTITALDLDEGLTFTDIADKAEAGEIGGGGSSEKNEQKPKISVPYIKINENDNATLISMKYSQPTITDYTFEGGTPAKKGIVFGWVRDDYTLSSNLELIAETEWFYSDVRQKLVVCWCSNLTQTFSITQNTAGRMALGYIMIRKGKKPTSTILNTTTSTGTANYIVHPTNKFCLFISSFVFGRMDYQVDNNFDHAVGAARTDVISSTDDKEKTLILPSGAGSGIIGLEIEYDDN